MKKRSRLLDVHTDCSRRTLLKGLGVAAAATLVPSLPGCAQQGSDLPTAQSSTCGSDMCIDLTTTANAPLTAAGGAMLIDMGSDTVMVIRKSDTEVIALSAICTHAGCSTNFDATKNLVVCPCHGSEFDETGAVVQGPARKALKLYGAALANNTITVSATAGG